MTVLIIIAAAFGIFVLLLAAALINTLLTPSKTADYRPAADPQREEVYAGKLSEMVRYETVSVRGEIQREKFLGFHEVLEKLFPLVHEKLEKTENKTKEEEGSDNE